ncbi:hypothetical protein COV93_02010 [Candidatus Woesearchaeota archaeon CG11_big_fil_rev_8_21_14_0_20_43_8]|nr:MAG: hypothetical protein COV93_02010 [Candidatus Woesearchaeota archaeon CG11_big_fil_rev_8_21_14_0_20_43_8]PIO07051.1 MAG: hypothetical protein COT47_01700 [Candidatus Woesearchaeota archaeon CG08_land_8_20_14_0_20_43_7]
MTEQGKNDDQDEIRKYLESNVSKQIKRRGYDFLGRTVAKWIGLPPAVGQVCMLQDLIEFGKEGVEYVDKEKRTQWQSGKWAVTYAVLDMIVTDLEHFPAELEVKGVKSHLLEPVNDEMNLIWVVESIYKNIKKTELVEKGSLLRPLEDTLDILNRNEVILEKDYEKGLKGTLNKIWDSARSKIKKDYNTYINLTPDEFSTVYDNICEVHRRTFEIFDAYASVLNLKEGTESTGPLTVHDIKEIHKACKMGKKVYGVIRQIIKK